MILMTINFILFGGDTQALFLVASYVKLKDRLTESLGNPVFVPIIMIIENLKAGPTIAARSRSVVDEIDNPPSYDDLFPERINQSGISNLELIETEESDL